VVVPRAVIFDLGGTLVQLPDGDEAIAHRWARAYDELMAEWPGQARPTRAAFVEAMVAAEMAHWRRVNAELWSGPARGLLADGFARLGLEADDETLGAALDAYARAAAGLARADPDALATLVALRERGYGVALLSNTWWVADWHNADLATLGLAELLDALVYTSELPHSKPHPAVFHEVADRLGVAAEACVMVGDRMKDDVGGALGAGMRGVWRANDSPWPKPDGVVPSAVVTRLSELPPLLRTWGGA
jgi:putative hydrolase of the HAD superfamily